MTLMETQRLEGMEPPGTAGSEARERSLARPRRSAQPRDCYFETWRLYPSGTQDAGVKCHFLWLSISNIPCNVAKWTNSLRGARERGVEAGARAQSVQEGSGVS